MAGRFREWVYNESNCDWISNCRDFSNVWVSLQFVPYIGGRRISHNARANGYARRNNRNGRTFAHVRF